MGTALAPELIEGIDALQIDKIKGLKFKIRKERDKSSGYGRSWQYSHNDRSRAGQEVL